MDYSRQGVKERQKDVRSTTSRLASKFWIMVLRILLIVIVGVGISGVMAVGGAFDNAGITLLLFLGIALQKKLRGTADGIHGSSDFMAHVGQEIGLGLCLIDRKITLRKSVHRFFFLVA